MKLKNAGFFKELPHGDKSGISLAENVSDTAIENEEEIIKYLDNGELFISCPGIATDVMDKNKIAGCPNIYTDGVWTWPGDLVYYIRHYHVKLPEEFISHMKSNGWIIPSIDLDNISL